MSGKTIRPKKRIVINPMTGNLDSVTDNNFSYEKVPQNRKLIIHENHQMLVVDELEVDGDLDLYGSLILEE